MMLLHASRSSGKAAAAAHKAFLHAAHAHPPPASLLERALIGHDLTLKVGIALLSCRHVQCSRTASSVLQAPSS